MKNLKPFDLQAALSGKAVMLRDGRKAYVRYHETELDVNPDCKLLGYDTDRDQLSWHENGSYLSARANSESDIIGMCPETRIINGFEVPAPETNELEHGTEFYLASPIKGQLYVTDVWDCPGLNKLWLERGLVFLNAEDAIATAKAMLGIGPDSETE